MLKRLSNADDEQLRYYLARIREIAASGDEAALIETDKLLWEFTQASLHDDLEYEKYVQADTAIHYPGDDAIRQQNASETLNRFRRKVESNTVRHFDIDNFRHEVARIGRGYPYGESTDETLAAIKAECLAIAELAETVAFQKVLSDALESDFRNINSVVGMTYEIDRAIERFSEKHEITHEMTLKARQAKERGARFRSDKKLASAKAYDGTGLSGKASGLRREAQALLTLDWATIFPGASPPSIDQ